MERIYLDGWEVTQGTTRQWEARDGTEEFAGMDGSDPTVPSRDGAIWRSKTLAPGSYQLSMWVRGATHALVRAEWENVVKVVNRRNRPIVIRRILDNGRTIEAIASLVGAARPVHVGQGVMRAVLTFALPEGAWYSPETYGTNSAPANLTERTLTIPALAVCTAPTPATVTIHGPTTLCVVTDQTDTGPNPVRPSLTYSGTIPAGATLTLNSATWGITATGFTFDVGKLRYSGRRFLDLEQPLPGGTPTVKVFTAGAGAGTKVDVTAKAAFAV